MTVQNSTWVTDLQADEEREKRIQIALLRGVVESIKSNRLVAPIFGLAVCAMAFGLVVGLIDPTATGSSGTASATTLSR